VRLVADLDGPGDAARAAVSTHREGRRARHGCPGRDRERAASPGVGDALRGDAVRVLAPGGDRPGALPHLDLAAGAADAPRAADAEARARLGRRRGHGHAAIAAAAPGALREDPARALSWRLDLGFICADARDAAAVARRAARAAHRDGHGADIRAGGGDRESTRAAAAARALRMDSRGVESP